MLNALRLPLVAVLLLLLTSCSARSTDRRSATASSPKERDRNLEFDVSKYPHSAPQELKSYFDNTDTLAFHVDAIPMQDGIRNLFLVDNTLLVQTQNYTVWALRADSLVVLWKWTGMKSDIEFEPVANYSTVYFIAKSVLYAVNRENGAEKWRMELLFSPSAGPAEHNFSVYIPTWEGKIYSVEDLITRGQQAWSHGSGGEVKVHPIVKRTTTSAFLYATAESGVMTRFNVQTDSGIVDYQQIYRFGGSVSTPPVASKNGVFVGSEDYNLYYYDSTLTKINGIVKTGSPIRYVDIHDDYLFYRNDKYGFSCLNIGYLNTERRPAEIPNFKEQDMPVMWQASDISHFVFSGLRYHYFSDFQGNLIASRQKGAKRDWAHDTDAFDFVLVNHDSQLLIAATRSGFILNFNEKP